MSPYQHWRHRLQSESRRGVILVLSTLLVIAGFGMVALAVDVGWMILTQAQLQNAADSAALAAVLELKAADEGLTQAELRSNAIEEAQKAAALNQAAGRDVILDPAEISLGNRHRLSGEWQTVYGNSLPYNAVRVDVAYDEASGPRRELGLFFAKIFGIDRTAVGAGGNAFLTPKDMVFLLDISRSMSYDTGDAGVADVLYPEISDHSREYEAPHWAGNFYQYTWERSVLNLVWGDDITEMLEFAEREFQGAEPYFNYDPTITWAEAQADPNLIAKMFPTRVWLHWKFKAFSDYVYETSNNDSVVYNNTNKNVVRNRKTNRVMSIVEWSKFLSYNGLVPSVKGQDFYPRASGKFKNNLDSTFPPAGAGSAAAPYPNRVEYYPKPKHIPGFSASALGVGAGFTGIYPGEVEVQPMTAVRRASLHGIHAMISEDNIGNEAFDQVAMITFGAFGHVELDLTNDLDLALEVAVSRLTYGPTNRNIPEWTNGFTNIGMPIRQGIDLLKNSPKARAWTQKVMVLLSDGEPKISPSGGNTASEFGGSGTTAAYGVGAATSYAEFWADKAGEAGITIHTIAVGDADEVLMKSIADRTGGKHEVVTDPVAQADELKDIFIDLAKDKLGKLYTEL